MSATAPRPARSGGGRRLAWAGFWLGFGLAMFFDGIVLHQILQWHHLLSGVAPEATADDLRFQVLADGIFHAVTYALTTLGLWLLWAGRGGLGFGAWHVADAVLNHWIVGLHRIRMAAEHPLAWDLLWVVPFGLGALLAGLRLLRRPPSGGPGGLRRSAPLLLALAVLTAGPISALPPADVPAGRALVVFRPGMSFADIVTDSEAAHGRPVWSDRAGGVWLIALDPGESAARLYRHGVLLVSNGPVAVGSWFEV
jgi:uncharacterized membrane protein